MLLGITHTKVIYHTTTVMIWFLKLLIFAQVLVDCQQRNVDAGYITWEVVDVPVVFGEDVVIRCTYHTDLSCTGHIFWAWTIGALNELIMNGGILSEKFKYENKFSEKKSPCFQSKLVISNFSETDYSETYKCGISYINYAKKSFVKYPKEEVNFENTSYEFVPSIRMVSTELSIRNPQISFILTIDKIYPLPECQATFKDTDVTDSLNVQKRKIGLFYNVKFTYTTNNMSMESLGDLCITCNGNRSQWKTLHPFCTNKSDLRIERKLGDTSSVEGYYMYLVIEVIGGIFYTLYPVFVMVKMIRLYSANKDQIDKMKQIENTPYDLVEGCLMAVVLIFGVQKLKVRAGLHNLIWMNIFHIIAILSPVIFCIPISFLTVFAKRKLPKEKWYSRNIKNMEVVFLQTYQLFCAITYFGFWLVNMLPGSDSVQSGQKDFSIKAIEENIKFYFMQLTGMVLLTYFLLLKGEVVISIKRFHIIRNKRLHRKTEGKTKEVKYSVIAERHQSHIVAENSILPERKTKEVNNPVIAERHQSHIVAENSILPDIIIDFENKIIGERHMPPIERKNSIISECSESFHTASNSQSEEEHSECSENFHTTSNSQSDEELSGCSETFHTASNSLGYEKLSENAESGITASNRQSEEELSSYV